MTGTATMTADTSNKSLSILVAEDHPTNQIVVRHHLEKRGHRVSVAADGQDAVQQCAAQRFDLIFMDVQMPVMDGIEACRLIRAGDSENRDAPIYAVTAGTEAMTRQACLEAGMTEVITKPLLFEQLGDILENRLRNNAPPVKSPRNSNPSIAPAQGRPEALNEYPIDFPKYLARLDGDSAFAKQMLQGFILQNDHLLAQMAENIQQGDFASLRISAHTIKGGALNIAASDLREAAQALENAENADSASLNRLLSKLTKEHERIRQFSDRFSAERPSQTP
jgi:CheY-like chemotaxis protein